MAKQEPPKDFLEWLGIRSVPDLSVARPLGYAFGVFLLVASIALFFGSILAAVTTLYRAIFVETTTTGAAGIATLIVAIIGGPFLVWRTIIAHRTLGFQKEGHITDRISKAVEQLGAEKTTKKQLANKDGKKLFHKGDSGEIDLKLPVMIEETEPNIEVRIGGLLSLERIAQDSVRYDGGRDHVRVMEIICAYVRQNSSSSQSQSSPSKKWDSKEIGNSVLSLLGKPSRNTRFSSDYHSREILGWVRGLREPRADICVAMAILGRRSTEQRLVELQWSGGQKTIADPFRIGSVLSDLVTGRTKRNLFEHWTDTPTNKIADLRRLQGYRIDLRNCNLQGIDLRETNFSLSMFDGSKCDGADFSFATLVGASFEHTSLIGAAFSRSLTVGAKFTGSQMECSHFFNARLSSADFEFVNMPGSVLTTALLDHADFAGSELSYSEFRNAKFVDTFLYNTSMQFGDFAGASATNTRLVNCDLTACTFTEGANEPFIMDGCRVEHATYNNQRL